MRGLMLRWLILTFSILVGAHLMDGIHVDGFFPAFFAAAVLGVLNALFRPVLLIITLPVNILTLGLFTFVINAFLLQMASGVIPGFYIAGFWSAVFGSLLISLVSFFLTAFVGERGNVAYIGIHRIDRRR